MGLRGKNAPTAPRADPTRSDLNDDKQRKKGERRLDVFKPERELVGFFDRLWVDGKGSRAKGEGSHEDVDDAPESVILTRQFLRNDCSSSAPLSLQSWPSRRHTEARDGWCRPRAASLDTSDRGTGTKSSCFQAETADFYILTGESTRHLPSDPILAKQLKEESVLTFMLVHAFLSEC